MGATKGRPPKNITEWFFGKLKSIFPKCFKREPEWCFSDFCFDALFGVFHDEFSMIA
jgi:hypothetical protein